MNIVLERVRQETQLLDIGDALFTKCLRSDVNGEVFRIGVHFLVKETALTANSNGETHDEVRRDREAVHGENVTKTICDR